MLDNCITTPVGKIFSLIDTRISEYKKLFGPQNDSVAGLCKRHVRL